MQVAVAAQAPGFYQMMGRPERSGSIKLDIPDAFVNVGGPGYGLIVPEALDFDPTANEDGSLDGDMALGEDIYIYAVPRSADDAKADLIASKNATTPSGYTATNSRRIMGFHYGRVRPITERFNASYTCPTEIIPNSVWDLHHRPTCEPSGMIEVIRDAAWLDIYLASEDGQSWPNTGIVSEYNATPLTGTEGYALYYDYIRITKNSGKRLPHPHEWLAGAYGVPQGATGASGRINTGQHSDYGFDCVSCLNVDQPIGNVYQTLGGLFDRRHDDDGWKTGVNAGKDSSHDHGEWYGGDMRVFRAGGTWSNAS